MYLKDNKQKQLSEKYESKYKNQEHSLPKSQHLTSPTLQIHKCSLLLFLIINTSLLIYSDQWDNITILSTMLQFLLQGNISMQPQMHESQHQQEPIQQEQVDKILTNTDVWALNSSKFTPQWRAIFHTLKKVQTEQLWMDQNDHSEIIFDLIRPTFITLKFLCLSKNRIRSVQAIIWLKANFLQELNLDGNNIVKVKALRRADLPHLQYLSIADNPVVDITCISQMGCRWARLDLQYVDSEVVGESMAWICKLGKGSLERIYVESEKRIRNGKITGMLEQMYPNISIYDHDN